MIGVPSHCTAGRPRRSNSRQEADGSSTMARYSEVASIDERRRASPSLHPLILSTALSPPDLSPCITLPSVEPDMMLESMQAAGNSSSLRWSKTPSGRTAVLSFSPTPGVCPMERSSTVRSASANVNATKVSSPASFPSAFMTSLSGMPPTRHQAAASAMLDLPMPLGT